MVIEDEKKYEQVDLSVLCFFQCENERKRDRVRGTYICVFSEKKESIPRAYSKLYSFCACVCVAGSFNFFSVIISVKYISSVAAGLNILYE